MPTVHLNAWLPVENEADAALVGQQIGDFIAAADGISMTVTLLDEAPRTLALFLADDPANTPAPDLLEVDLFTLPQLVNEGLVAVLPVEAAAMNDVHPLLSQAVTFDGSVYCLPKDVHTLGLFYNKALFDAAGIGYPNESWTWVDLVAAAEAIGGLPTVEFSAYGLALGADVSRWLPFYLQETGGTRAPETNLEPAALSTALTRYVELYADGLAITPSYYGRSWSGPVFGNGRVGMVIEGNWLAAYLADEFPDLAYGVAPLPSGSSDSTTLAFGSCYAVNAASEKPAYATALAVSLAGDEAMRARLEHSVALPARFSTAVAWEVQYPHLRALRTQLDRATIWQTTPVGEQTLEMLQDILEDLLAGDLAVDEAVNEILQIENE